MFLEATERIGSNKICERIICSTIQLLYNYSNGDLIGGNLMCNIYFVTLHTVNASTKTILKSKRDFCD